MKTQPGRNLALLVSGLSLFLAYACGVSSKPHYKHKKNYGEMISNEDKKDQEVTLEEEAPANPQSEPTGSVDIEEEAGEIPPPLDPNLVVYRPLYKAAMDIESIRLLKKSEVGESGRRHGLVIDPWAMRDLALLLQSWTRLFSEKAKLVISQTLGDRELNKSTFAQKLESPTDQGLLSKILAKPSDSRTETFRRRVGVGACPTSFVCVDRQYYASKDGHTMTSCYYEAATGKSTTIPYTPSPKSKRVEFEPAFRTYPDYVAVIHRGKNIECQENLDDQRGGAWSIEHFRVTVTKVQDSRLPGRKRFVQKEGVLPIDFGVHIKLDKIYGDNNLRTYSDESLVLQNESSYYFNESKSMVVKFVKTIRKPFNETITSALSLIPGVSKLLSHDGIRLDYHFEFCQDQSDSEQYGTYYCNE